MDVFVFKHMIYVVATQDMAASPLPTHSLEQGRRKDMNIVDTRNFPAGARTPPWAPARPNLLFLYNVYMAGSNSTH